MKPPSCKNFLLNVQRKGIYVIWVRLKSKKAELEQVKVYRNMLGCFDMLVAAIEGLFSQTQSNVFVKF